MGIKAGKWTSLATIIAASLVMSVSSADGQAPRTADGRPNLNGIWQSINTANWDVEPHAAGPSLVRELGAIVAVPAGLGVVEGGEIPYRPEARAKRDENRRNRLEVDPRSNAICRACHAPHICHFRFRSFKVANIS